MRVMVEICIGLYANPPLICRNDYTFILFDTGCNALFMCIAPSVVHFAWLTKFKQPISCLGFTGLWQLLLPSRTSRHLYKLKTEI